MAIADLARRITERESEQSPPVAPDRREAVYCSLYHCHVPKLADADVVEHERDQDTVEPGANFEPVAELLTSLSEVTGPDAE